MNDLIDLFDDGRDPFSPVAIRGENAVATPPDPPPGRLGMPRFFSLEVVGTPRPQGSKKAFVSKRTGRAFVVDDNGEKLRTWRQDVVGAAVTLIKDSGSKAFPLSRELPVAIAIVFRLPRPKGHWRSGRNAHLLRDDAPAFPTTKPDIDKLERSTLDALRDAGVYSDDCQIFDVRARKVYATERPGALIYLEW